jgi:nitrite reductase/ring-hydroxylating ferredoxin subunit
MGTEPQGRFDRDDPALGVRLPIAGSSPHRDERDPQEVTRAPDHRPLEEQPQWRKDFPIDWPLDHHVARRDFAKFLVLTSGAFVVGQGWIALNHLTKQRRPAAPRVRIASLRDVPVGTSIVFSYPTEHQRCLLIRPEEGVLVAYSQSCTHLACAVVPRIEEGVLHCPCHEGFFDLRSGRNIAGPPPRPLPRIVLDLDGDEVFAVGVEERTV